MPEPIERVCPRCGEKMRYHGSINRCPNRPNSETKFHMEPIQKQFLDTKIISHYPLKMSPPLPKTETR